MWSFLAVSVSIAVCLGLVPSADAFDVASQNRYVSANASAFDYKTEEEDTAGESFSAPDFGPFAQGAGATAQVTSALGGGSGTQNSQILPNGFLAFGTVGCSAEAWDFSGEATSDGTSHFEVAFDIQEATPYTLSGLISAYDSGYTTLDFNGPGGTVFSTDAGGGEQPFSESGTLAPGQYTFTVEVQGSAYGDVSFSDYASGDYDIAFQLLTVTDVESDGVMPSTWGSIKAAYGDR